MVSLAIYLFFVSVLSSYRSSKYWPTDVKIMPWLSKFWWSWGGIILGSTIMLIEKGLTVGILVSLCAYMVVSCCILFFASANGWFRSTALILFHAVCLLGLILKF